LVDTEGPQSVAQILAAMPPGTTRGSAESAIKREFDAGRIERVAAGVYRLAPPKPPESPKRPSTPPPPTPDEEAMWLSALETRVVDRSSWDVDKLGPPPHAPNNKVPPAVKMRFNDRLWKREERRRDREAAQARQAADDAQLRNKLLSVTGGNFMAGHGLDAMTVIRSMLQVVRLEDVLIGLKRVVDRRLDPQAAPIAYWTDKRFLEAVARRFASDHPFDDRRLGGRGKDAGHEGAELGAGRRHARRH
jgi:hypothetical protein